MQVKSVCSSFCRLEAESELTAQSGAAVAENKRCTDLMRAWMAKSAEGEEN